MDSLMEAGRRLEAAVIRLENAVDRADQAPREDSPPDQGQDGLAQTTAMVAARLDEAIARIDRLLQS